MIKYSIVVPVFRGENTISELHNRCINTFQEHKLDLPEIIFVYDCGDDNSWEIIKKLAIDKPETIKGIKLSRNFGQHNALICGFNEASGDFIITMDEDLQQLPEDIIKLIRKQKATNADVVYGKFKNLKHKRFRNFTSKTLKALLKLGIPELHNDYSAFRLIKAPIAKELCNMRNSYSFLDGYLTWITSNIESVEVNHASREIGKSTYTLKKLIEHSINIFVTFSNLPIRILTSSSILIFIATIIYSAFILYKKFIGKIDVPGYTSLTISIGLGVGFILLGLGIIGEYIYRINLKTTKRPNYKIGEKT